MYVRNLVEDISQDATLIPCEHGLSYYIETKNHKILFDLGASDLFAENGKRFGIDLKDVDTVILSHGHYDHTGGLRHFMQMNSKADIYLRVEATGDYYSKKEGGFVYIGMEPELKKSNRIHWVSKELRIDDELLLFGDVINRECMADSNSHLKVMQNGEYVQDSFIHEQSLLITQGTDAYLIAGCMHCGVVNILKRAEEFLEDKKLRAVFGGLHISNPRTKQPPKQELVEELVGHLKKWENTVFYTGHCTGREGFEMLHQLLPEQIQYLFTGQDYGV